MVSGALEKHYRVKDLATLWGFSDNTIIRLFSNEPGVISLGSVAGKRKYATLSIPESVALRVHNTLTNEVIASQLGPVHSLRVIRLGDVDAETRKKASSQGETRLKGVERQRLYVSNRET